MPSATPTPQEGAAFLACKMLPNTSGALSCWKGLLSLRSGFQLSFPGTLTMLHCCTKPKCDTTGNDEAGASGHLEKNKTAAKQKETLNLPLFICSVSPVQVRVHHHSTFPMPSEQCCRCLSASKPLMKCVRVTCSLQETAPFRDSLNSPGSQEMLLEVEQVPASSCGGKCSGALQIPGLECHPQSAAHTWVREALLLGHTHKLHWKVLSKPSPYRETVHIPGVLTKGTALPIYFWLCHCPTAHHCISQDHGINEAGKAL